MREKIVESQDLYKKIKKIITTSRINIYGEINKEMLKTYWTVGKAIVEDEQKGKEKAKYGEHILKNLSQKLLKQFGGGFTLTNLKYMRQFYIAFPILSEVRRELTWTHYRLLMKVEKPKARKYYINEVIDQNWSTRALERQIHTLYYERILSNKNNLKIRKEAKDKTKPLAAKPEDFIKEPFIMDFFNIEHNDIRNESELEKALMDNLQKFLLELGKGFSFVARQKRITLEDDDFYIDLVFYNYILKCFVLIDLKIGKLTHKDIGQLDFYVRYFEKEKKQSGDNPTIGLILCADKNEAMVKYTLLDDNKNIFASKYKMYLPSVKELEEELQREKEKLELELKLNKEKV